MTWFQKAVRARALAYVGRSVPRLWLCHPGLLRLLRLPRACGAGVAWRARRRVDARHLHDHAGGRVMMRTPAEELEALARDQREHVLKYVSNDVNAYVLIFGRARTCAYMTI